MNTRHIGYVTTSISTHAGWDTLSKGIVNAVAKQHKTTVLTAKDAENDTTSYPIHAVLPTGISFSLWTQARIFVQCLRFLRHVDAIHALVEPYAPGAALAAWVLRKPFLITLAGTYCVIPTGSRLRDRIKRRMMVAMYRSASFIATGSLKNIELIEQVVPLEQRWKFVPFGIDLTAFQPTTDTRTDTPFVLTVGGLKPRKGTDMVVRALSLLKDKHPNLKYKIAGGFKPNTPFLDHLKRVIQETGMEGRVEILGRVSDQELRSLYTHCSAMVLAAQTVNGSFEGFPMVFYEAQACGAPVIGTTGYGSDYIIHPGENGFLIPQGVVEPIAEAIDAIVGDPALRASMSTRAIEEAARHTWDHISVHYLAAYDRVCSTPPASKPTGKNS